MFGWFTLQKSPNATQLCGSPSYALAVTDYHSVKITCGLVLDQKLWHMNLGQYDEEDRSGQGCLLLNAMAIRIALHLCLLGCE